MDIPFFDVQEDNLLLKQSEDWYMSDEINEITEEHSDYKPADARDENVKHQLTGMYQN